MKIRLNNVRIAFPALDKPKAFEAGQDLKYSATFLIEPGSDNEKLVRDTIAKIAKEKWADKAPAMLKALEKGDKLCIHDGDQKAQYDGFEDMMYVSANTKASAPPSLFDGQKNKLERDSGMIYAGCYVNAIIDVYAQDNNFGKRINAGLSGVQFNGHGDAFGGGAPASADDFDVAETVELDDEDFEI